MNLRLSFLKGEAYSWDTAESEGKNFFSAFTCHESGGNLLQHRQGIAYFPSNNNSHAKAGLKKAGQGVPVKRQMSYGYRILYQELKVEMKGWEFVTERKEIGPASLYQMF